VDAFSLSITVLSGDPTLRRELERVGTARGHVITAASRLRDLRPKGIGPDVLVLDLADGPQENLAIANALQSSHPETAIVLVSDAQPRLRELGGYRVVDRWRSGDRLVGELELAFIGIPPVTGLHLEPLA
jgi:hypothetical protein